jgi:ribosomal-protein-alanine N-acetyltransferase
MEWNRFGSGGSNSSSGRSRPADEQHSSAPAALRAAGRCTPSTELILEGVVVRNLVIADADAISHLERSIFTDPWSKSVFLREARLAGESHNRVIADSGSGEVLAYSIAWFVADEVHLANVAVRPEARRRGLAQHLLDDLEAEARQKDARMIVLEVRRSNHSAQELYRKNGFYPVSVRRRYYQDNREDALVMIKPLHESGRIAALENP